MHINSVRLLCQTKISELLFMQKKSENSISKHTNILDYFKGNINIEIDLIVLGAIK